MPEASIHTLFPLRYFIETPAPAVNSAEWRKLNHSKYEFGVTNKDGLLLITRGPRGARCELKIPTGKLVGTDNLEKGGTLVYKSLDKTKPQIELKKGNIKFIFELKEVVYYIEALPHSNNNKGNMYRLDAKGDTFTSTKVLEFEDEPEAYAIFNGDLLLASYQNFYRITDLKKEIMLKDTFWYGLFPTSIAVMDEWHVYIGIRSGYVKLDLTTKKLLYYKYTV